LKLHEDVRIPGAVFEALAVGARTECDRNFKVDKVAFVV
jgi:hypothetical protein